MNRHVRRTVLAQLRGKLPPAEIALLDAIRGMTPQQLDDEIRRRKAVQPGVHLPVPRAPGQH